jgi:hypothetical protein
VVVDAEVNEANQTTLGSARRSVVENSLTGPTLLSRWESVEGEEPKMRR